MEPGYSQQGLQIPTHLQQAFRKEVGKLGSGGVKIAGTTALSIYMGMPPKLREWLYLWVLQQSWSGADQIKPEEVYQRFLRFIVESEKPGIPIVGDTEAGGDPVQPTHYVDKILDPAIKRPKKTAG